MTNDIEILLKELFATHTEYGKVPTSEGEFENQLSPQEAWCILYNVLIAYDILKEASSDYGD